MVDGLTRDDRLRALGIIGGATGDGGEGSGGDLIIDVEEEFGDFQSFKDAANNQSSFSEFQTYLVDNNILSEADATQFTGLLQGKYQDYTDFLNDIAQYNSFEDWSNNINFGVTLPGPGTGPGGGTVQGVKFHEEGGVSKDGVTVPAGTVEIFGSRIEFSQEAEPVENPDPDVTVQSFSVDPTTAVLNQDITFEATVKNTGSISSQFNVRLFFNGQVAASKGIFLDASGTGTVSFVKSFSSPTAIVATIEDSSGESVAVVPSGLF